MSTWTHRKVVVIETVINNVSVNFLQYNERFRNVRKKIKEEINNCQLCDETFVDGEMMHLAFTDKGNKLLCNTCKGMAVLSEVPHREFNVPKRDDRMI